MTEEQIRKIIKETVAETLLSMGCDISQPKYVQADFYYLRRLRVRSEQIGNKILMLFLGISVPALFYMVWEALKNNIRGQ